MKKSKKIVWGIYCILIALLVLAAIVLKGIGLLHSPGISVIRIVASTVLFALIVQFIMDRNFPVIYFPLAGLIMLWEAELATYVLHAENTDIFSNWTMLACAALLFIGTSVLTSGKKHRINIGRWRSRAGSFMGDSTKYIDCTDFTETSLENDIGSLTVRFENAQNYLSGGKLHLENDIGQITVIVEDDWKLDVNIENDIGQVKYPTSDGLPSDAKVLYIDGENDVGRIQICRKGDS
ncbi:MAG: hypothetical protein MJ101_07395 [Clostridia bacterium]|nr:hypothetical protein [Clostridia bacterium]